MRSLYVVDAVNDYSYIIYVIIRHQRPRDVGVAGFGCVRRSWRGELRTRHMVDRRACVSCKTRAPMPPRAPSRLPLQSSRRPPWEFFFFFGRPTPFAALSSETCVCVCGRPLRLTDVAEDGPVLSPAVGTQSGPLGRDGSLGGWRGRAHLRGRWASHGRRHRLQSPHKVNAPPASASTARFGHPEGRLVGENRGGTRLRRHRRGLHLPNQDFLTRRRLPGGARLRLRGCRHLRAHGHHLSLARRGARMWSREGSLSPHHHPYD